LGLVEKYFSPDRAKNHEIEILRTEIQNQLKILIYKYLLFQKAITVVGIPKTLAYIRKGMNNYNDI
jgi:hypothetical protein